MKLSVLREGRLDQVVAEALRSAGRAVSVREVRGALRSGRIRIGGAVARPGTTGRRGQSIELEGFVPRSEARIEPRSEARFQARLVAEGEGWIALDKPAGLPTLPLTPYEEDSLLHVACALRPEVAEAGPPLEGGAVHRLDNEASGLVLFATSPSVRRRFRAAFSEHRILKTYEAAVRPPPEPIRTRVSRSISSSGGRRSRLGPDDPEGPSSEVGIELDGRALVRTRWGRRHQVRLHLRALGYPIRGDTLYDGPPGARLALHGSGLEGEGLSLWSPVDFSC